MKLDYECTFNLDRCIKALGLEERGRVQQAVTNAVLEQSDPYVPLREGYLRGSGHIENGTDIVWRSPYAHYMWAGIVYEDPMLHCAGFKTEDGWRSRKGVTKLPTNRMLRYYRGSRRSAKWVEKMMQDGGREKIEQIARRAAVR